MFLFSAEFDALPIASCRRAFAATTPFFTVSPTRLATENSSPAENYVRGKNASKIYIYYYRKLEPVDRAVRTGQLQHNEIRALNNMQYI